MSSGSQNPGPCPSGILPKVWETWGLLNECSLCHGCRGILGLTPDLQRHRHEGGRFETELAELETAALDALGCPFCRAAYRAFNHFNGKMSEKVQVEFYVGSPDWRNVKVHWYVKIPPEAMPDPEQWGPDGTFCITIEQDAIPATSSSNRLQSTSSSLASGLRLARQSLHDCLTEPTHNCQPRPNFAIDWPQRLLRISAAVVTLVDFDGSMTGRFAALSYCWGDSQELARNPPFIATASTCASLRTGIPLSGLPLTVRQAVEVCVCLGIEYLWVDALCIIQDDTADWEREAKKMATVYTMATVTIIAASSTSCHSGFFHVDLGSVRLDSPLPPQHQLVARRVNRSGFHRFPKETGTHSGDPIDDRGWTYQEEFLATRYIKFTDNDIQWRCREGTACLCHQEAYTETEAVTLRLRPRAVNRWYRVVQNFNQRNFTVATDKLPAFSGVVKTLAPEMAAGAGKSSIYIAGLWRHLMLPGEDLLWYRYPGAPAHCYQDYVAPSFSWASVGTRIVFSNVDIKMGSWLSELVNADRELTPNSDEFGRILQAFLTLRGPLISCTIRTLPNQNPELELSPGQKLTLQSYRLDCAVSQVTLQTGKAAVQRSTSSGSSFSDTDAHILLLQTQESSLLNCHMLRGLLLGQLATSSEFQRLGLVRLQGSAEDVTKLKLEQQKHLVTLV